MDIRSIYTRISRLPPSNYGAANAITAPQSGHANVAIKNGRLCLDAAPALLPGSLYYDSLLASLLTVKHVQAMGTDVSVKEMDTPITINEEYSQTDRITHFVVSASADGEEYILGVTGSIDILLSLTPFRKKTSLSSLVQSRLYPGPSLYTGISWSLASFSSYSKFLAVEMIRSDKHSYLLAISKLAMGIHNKKFYLCPTVSFYIANEPQAALALLYEETLVVGVPLCRLATYSAVISSINITNLTGVPLAKHKIRQFRGQDNSLQPLCENRLMRAWELTRMLMSHLSIEQCQQIQRLAKPTC